MAATIMTSTGENDLPLDVVITPFLRKLLTLTSTLPAEVGGWDPTGAVFIITDGERFETLLKRHFKGTLQTFVRQLHFYGFSKSELPRLAPHAWSFSHPYFVRDSPNLVAEIKRKSNNRTVSPLPDNSKKRLRNRHVSFAEDDKCKCQTAVIACKGGPNTKAEIEIRNLQEKIRGLQNTIDYLLKIVHDDDDLALPDNKKQKLDPETEDNAFVSQSNIIKRFSDASAFSQFADLPLMDELLPSSIDLACATLDNISTPQQQEQEQIITLKRADSSSMTEAFIKEFANMETPEAF